jgi:uncharacterized protein YjiS (DUF1127 family)
MTHILTTTNWIGLSWLRNKIENFFFNVERNREIRLTMKELNRLSDSELRDIGISRDDIWSVAHEVHYDNRLKTNKNLKGWV